MQEFDEFFRGYLVAALWSSTDTHPETGEDVNLDDEDWEWGEGVEEKLKEGALDFFTQHRELLNQYAERRHDPDDPSDGVDPSQGTVWDYAGHDFWLTRCGHGAGFWDRGLDDLGRQLTDACKAFGNIDLYLGDDLKVYAG